MLEKANRKSLGDFVGYVSSAVAKISTPTNLCFSAKLYQAKGRETKKKLMPPPQSSTPL